MNHLDFTIDFETCALSANAAPMQVAIVPWWRDAVDDPFILPEEKGSAWPDPYVAYIDLRSCVVEGMDFDSETVGWWNRQSDNAKHVVCSGLAEPVSDVTIGGINYIRTIIKQHQPYSICLWAHGMDIDIAIIRSLCRRFSIDLEDCIPHTSFRDCRTLILEAALIEAERAMFNKSSRAAGIGLPYQIQADQTLAYKIFDPLPEQYTSGREPHDALYDVLRSSWYTWQSLKSLRS